MPSSNPIQRYTTYGNAVSAPDGDWVEYANHLTALQEVERERVEEADRAEGANDEATDQKAAADEYATELSNIRALFDDAPTEALNLVRDLKSRAEDRLERLEAAESRAIEAEGKLAERDKTLKEVEALLLRFISTLSSADQKRIGLDRIAALADHDPPPRQFSKSEKEAIQFAREDPEFRERLRRSIEENKELLDRLADSDPPEEPLRFPIKRGRCGTCQNREGVVCDLCGNGLGAHTPKEETK